MRVARTYLAASFNAAYNEMKGVNDTPMPPSNVGFNLYATLHCTHTYTHTHRLTGGGHKSGAIASSARHELSLQWQIGQTICGRQQWQADSSGNYLTRAGSHWCHLLN